MVECDDILPGQAVLTCAYAWPTALATADALAAPPTNAWAIACAAALADEPPCAEACAIELADADVSP